MFFVQYGIYFALLREFDVSAEYRYGSDGHCGVLCGQTYNSVAVVEAVIVPFVIRIYTAEIAVLRYYFFAVVSVSEQAEVAVFAGEPNTCASWSTAIASSILAPQSIQLRNRLPVWRQSVFSPPSIRRTRERAPRESYSLQKP